MFSLWLFLAFAGFAIALGSLAALQHYENHTGLSVTRNPFDGTHVSCRTSETMPALACSWAQCLSVRAGWALESNYPLLPSGRVFRLDWYIVMQQFVTNMFILVALCSRVIPQVTSPCMHHHASAVPVLLACMHIQK